MLDHPRSAIVGLSLILKFGLYPIYSFGDIAIFIFCHYGLKLPIHANFGGGFGGILPPNMIAIVLTPKDHPCAQTRRLSHKVWKLVKRFDLGTGSRKKVRAGQSKKSQSGNISPIWGEAPTVLTETKICMTGNLADIIIYAKFQDDIFRGTNLQGVEFPIFLWTFAWALQQCSATVLPMITSKLIDALMTLLAECCYDNK